LDRVNENKQTQGCSTWKDEGIAAVAYSQEQASFFVSFLSLSGLLFYIKTEWPKVLVCVCPGLTKSNPVK
jgi:hypothetical protein